MLIDVLNSSWDGIKVAKSGAVICQFDNFLSFDFGLFLISSLSSLSNLRFALDNQNCC